MLHFNSGLYVDPPENSNLKKKKIFAVREKTKKKPKAKFFRNLDPQMGKIHETYTVLYRSLQHISSNPNTVQLYNIFKYVKVIIERNIHHTSFATLLFTFRPSIS